jgi:hypothetical protein
MSTDIDDTLIPAAQVRARYGDVSHMWLVRRLNDDPEFPRPVYISTRRFWRRGALVAWERALACRPARHSVAT